MTTIYNLATRETRDYSCDPVRAVVAAYAQERKDWNTWQYTRYWHLVDYTRYHYTIGDWCVRHGL